MQTDSKTASTKAAKRNTTAKPNPRHLVDVRYEDGVISVHGPQWLVNLGNLDKSAVEKLVNTCLAMGGEQVKAGEPLRISPGPHYLPPPASLRELRRIIRKQKATK